MRSITFLMLALATTPLSAAAQEEPETRAPFVVEQTYWIKPSKELQFIGLFEKNRAPLLRAKIKDGSVLWVRLSKPQFNATNEQWDLRVVVAWRDVASAMEPSPQSKTQLTIEQQLMEEIIVEQTEVPVQEWSINGAAI